MARNPLVLRRRRRRAAKGRQGAILSMELLFVLPLVATFFLAIVEFGMLWSANQRVKLASVQGCRVAVLPGACAADVKAAVAVALGKVNLLNSSQVLIEGGRCAGDPVAVEVVVPMRAAAPDMLAMFGFGLQQRQLIARTVMRVE